MSTVILKPSPLTPLKALLLGDIADQAGLPPGTLNVVTSDVKVGERVTTDPRIDVITFTGSDLVGTAVMGQAAPSLKRVLLELGGKSAMIIRSDADLAARYCGYFRVNRPGWSGLRPLHPPPRPPLGVQ